MRVGSPGALGALKHSNAACGPGQSRQLVVNIHCAALKPHPASQVLGCERPEPGPDSSGSTGPASTSGARSFFFFLFYFIFLNPNRGSPIHAAKIWPGALLHRADNLTGSPSIHAHVHQLTPVFHAQVPVSTTLAVDLLRQQHITIVARLVPLGPPFPSSIPSIAISTWEASNSRGHLLIHFFFFFCPNPAVDLTRVPSCLRALA